MSKRTDSSDVFEQLHDAESDALEVKEASEAGDSADQPAADPVLDVRPDVLACRRGRRPSLTAAAVALLLLLSIGTSVFLGWREYQQHRLDAASTAALQAAKDYAVVLTTLDAKNIDDNYRKSLDGATGEFKDAYSQGANQLRQVLIDNKASGTGVVVSAAVKSATTDKVEVLLFVDQSITNAQNPSPRIDRNRIDMTMDRVGDRWLAGKVEIL
jgi:Mce-associated membrane protein